MCAFLELQVRLDVVAIRLLQRDCSSLHVLEGKLDVALRENTPYLVIGLH